MSRLSNTMGVHPRLFFSVDDLPAIRKKLAHPDCQPTWDRLLRACEAMAEGTPSPVHTRHVRAAHLAFAYLITGRREFADAARRLARVTVDLPDWLMASERNPARSVRAGLATGAALAELSLVYDWAYDALSPAERLAIEEACFKKGIEPALMDIREGVYPHLTDEERESLKCGPVTTGLMSSLIDVPDTVPNSSRYTTNGMGVLNGPLAMAALVFEDGRDTREALAAAVMQLRRTLSSFCPEGGYPESPLYWNYYLRHVLLGLVPLKRLKGLDALQLPFIIGTGNYIQHHILPGFRECANTADGFASTHLWPAIPFLATYCQRTDWQWLARSLLQVEWGEDGENLEYSLFYLIFYDPELPALRPSRNETVGLFSGIQHLAMRSDWDSEAIHALWLNGPANTHHNHQHLNSLTVSAYGRRLLVELGKYDYSNSQDPRRKALCHNTLLAGSDEQAITLDNSQWCRRLRAGQWGTVYGLFERLRQEAGAVIATGRVFHAYPGRIRRFDRTLAFIERRFFLLHDFIELESEPPQALEWHFHSGGSIERLSQGAVFHNGPAQLRLQTLAAFPLESSVRMGPTELPEGPGVPCLDLKTSARTRTLDFYALLVPQKVDERQAFTLEFEGDGVQVTWQGQQWQYDPTLRKLATIF